MELHPAIAPLVFLVGTWEGTGRGVYPTIDAFDYRERVTFAATAKPVLRYDQLTWRVGGDEAPLHTETGWVRLTDAGPELVIAQPTGVAEVHRGHLAGRRLAFAATAVVTTPAAVEVREVERDLRVTGDELVYELRMAAVGQPLQVHLTATLRRVDEPTRQVAGTTV